MQEYYNGFANRTLWPLFHYRIDLTAFERSYGLGYARVNARFAETLRPLIEAGDMIWVQDYHLIPMARELRDNGVKNAIGFFLHIPWPARELMVMLPRHRQLVEALFHYDVIGFHTQEWLDAFKAYVVYEADGEVLPDGRLRAFGRTLRAVALPIGLDAKEFAAMLQEEPAQASFERMQESKLGRKMLLGVVTAPHLGAVKFEVPNALAWRRRFGVGHPRSERRTTRCCAVQSQSVSARRLLHSRVGWSRSRYVCDGARARSCSHRSRRAPL